MTEKTGAVIRLGPDRFVDAVDVLSEAFFDYPVMRWVAGTCSTADYRLRQRRLIELFTASRTLRDYPVLGATAADGTLVAVAAVNPAVARPVPPSLRELQEAVAVDLGADAMARLESFNAVGRRFEPATPHLHLGMLGVRRAFAGQGFGRRLLDAVHRLSLDDPDSSGVGLTTEDPANVPLYRHVGYEVVGEADVGDFRTWVFFRADRR